MIYNSEKVDLAFSIERIVSEIEIEREFGYMF